MDFIIDTEGDQELVKQDRLIGETTELAFNDGWFSKTLRLSFHCNLLIYYFSLAVESDVLSELIKSIKIFRENVIDEDKQKNALLKKNKERKDDDMMENFFVRMGWGKNIGQQTAKEKLEQTKNRFKMTNIDFDTGKLKMEAASTNVEKILEKSILKSDLEKLVSLPEYGISDRRLKAIRKVGFIHNSFFMYLCLF